MKLETGSWKQGGAGKRASRLSFVSLLSLALLVSAEARAQAYIGFVYPAGGQQGTTFQITLGGQALDGVDRVLVSGAGVRARVIEYNKQMNPQEMQLIQEQLRELKVMPAQKRDAAKTDLISRLEKFIDEYVQQPQCSSIANLVVAEVVIAKDAPPGEREIRVATPRGLSNPMVFYVGQLPEVSADPLPTSPKQILGKEAQSLRKTKRGKEKDKDMMMGMETMQMAMSIGGPGAQSDVDDDVVTLRLPCTVNGQIASGSVDRFRFTAHRGQRLVVNALARALVPYLADAVPGWFQPVLALCDAQGKEVSYDDDYRFKPDPVLLYDIPADGEYILVIYDAIFRGREDFVYRLTVGELPFVTSVFPLGGQAGIPTMVDLTGVNLSERQLTPPMKEAVPGLCALATRGKGGLLSNPVPFAIDTLPDGMESEPNNTVKNAQSVTLPVIMNGTIGTPGDQDLFQFEGRSGDEVVAEVMARRLDSPLDSMLKITDAAGTCLAVNDDQEDLGSGLNTHHADSIVRVKLPKSGTYTVHLSDAQHKGGEAYAYRLRISAPQPDFALRIVPSRVVMRSKDSASATVYAIRKDGFTGTIKLDVKDAASGFVLQGAPLVGTQTVARVTVKTTLVETEDPVNLIIQGSATNGTQRLVHDAVPAEDRMQTFLWRHLVPAQEFMAMVFDPNTTPEAPKKFRKK